jgi:shikimate kinase
VAARPLVIVVSGPIASGKSTVAQAVADELERAGVIAPIVDLDAIHDARAGAGAAGDRGSWARARSAAAAEADAHLEAGRTVVVAEGSFNEPGDRATFVAGLPARALVLHVTLHVTYEEALRRARSDPTRGRSRDATFLAAHYASRRAVLAKLPPTDLVFDTEAVPAPEIAATIARAIRLEPAGRHSGVADGPTT